MLKSRGSEELLVHLHGLLKLFLHIPDFLRLILIGRIVVALGVLPLLGIGCRFFPCNLLRIKALFLKAANTVIGATERFIAIFERTLAPALATDELERELADLEAEINIAAELVEECIRENAHVALDQAEYQKRYDGLASRYDKAKDRHDEVTELIAERISRRKRIELYFRELRKREPLETFRDEDWLSMVDHMTVYSKDDIRVTFKDGTEIST